MVGEFDKKKGLTHFIWWVGLFMGGRLDSAQIKLYLWTIGWLVTNDL